MSLTLFPMLSEEGRAILDFERSSLLEQGPKDLMIELVLGLGSAEYYERLRELVGTRAAFAYDPLTAKRVSRIIEETRESELAV
jgi:hypothetical protein